MELSLRAPFMHGGTMAFDSNSRLLITGATGSFGKAFIGTVLKQFPDISRIVIYSRDELKQWELQQEFPEILYPQLRYFLGDIRDRDRLRRALESIDTVVHAAALKQVPAAEYNPMEFIKTNVLGAEKPCASMSRYISKKSNSSKHRQSSCTNKPIRSH